MIDSARTYKTRQNWLVHSAASLLSPSVLFFYSTLTSSSPAGIEFDLTLSSPYSLLVYLVASAVLAAAGQPIAIAVFVTWMIPLGEAFSGDDQQRRGMIEMYTVIVGSALFYMGWCVLPEMRWWKMQRVRK